MLCVQALLPALIFAFKSCGVFEDALLVQPESPASPTKPAPLSTAAGTSKSTLAVLTGSALVAAYMSSGSITGTALGLSYAVLEASAFVVVDRARKLARYDTQSGGGVIYSANGLLAKPAKGSGSDEEQWISLLRDLSVAGTLTTGVAALTLESLSFRMGGLAYYGVHGHGVVNRSIFPSLVYALGIVLVHAAMYAAFLLVVSCLLTSIRLPTSLWGGGGKEGGSQDQSH